MSNEIDEALEDERREYQYAQAAHNAKSRPPMPKSGLVARYFKGLDCPDEYTADVIYIDRMTGREIFRYDGADPANTNPYYGATPDEDMFIRRGLDIREMIKPDQAVISVEECHARCRQDRGGYWED